MVGSEIDIAVLARPDGEARRRRRRSRSSPTGCSTTTRSTAAPPSSSSPRCCPRRTLKALEDAAVAVFDALGCAGVARIDFFLTDAGWVLNEVNTMPGFTEASQVPKMFAAAGLPYADLLDLLVSDALRGARSAVGCGGLDDARWRSLLDHGGTIAFGLCRIRIARVTERRLRPTSGGARELYAVGAVFSVGVFELARLRPMYELAALRADGARDDRRHCAVQAGAWGVARCDRGC